jgi:outer membrane lipoprotein-sorting protein
MRKYLLLGVTILFSFAFSLKTNLTSPEAQKAFTDLIVAIDAIKSMAFTITNHERIDGKMLSGTQRVSLTTEPFQCHISMINPGKGQELVYAGNTYEQQVVYEPAGFPYIQLELDPYGSLMRNKNHHTIFFLGFKKMTDIIQFHMSRSPFSLDAEKIKLDGKTYTKISIEFINFEYKKTKVFKEESVTSFSERMALCDYMIAEFNDLDLDDELEKDSELVVPSAYAKKFEILVDPDSGLPYKMMAYDEKGIYEHYEFVDLVINNSIPAARFDAKMLGKVL